MSNGILALLAFSPILLAAILLIGLRWPAKRAMPLPVSDSTSSKCGPGCSWGSSAAAWALRSTALMAMRNLPPSGMASTALKIRLRRAVLPPGQRCRPLRGRHSP